MIRDCKKCPEKGYVECLENGSRKRYPYAKADKKPESLDPTLIGNRIESFLTQHGITQEAYKAMKGVVGMAVTCNCDKRKEWLNRAHAWLRGETIEPLIDEPR